VRRRKSDERLFMELGHRWRIWAIAVAAAVDATGALACVPALRQQPARIETQQLAAPESSTEVDCPSFHSADCDPPPAEWNEEERYAMARMAMAEAEGEDTEGKALVILVIKNRVEDEHFPDTVEDVISQRNAFSSYSNGRYDRVEPDEDCYAALSLVESGWDESQGATFFEADATADTWHAKHLQMLYVHGAHTFYKEKRES
jgi:spore germination cell wall hydrolase CwlJ-like protein